MPLYPRSGWGFKTALVPVSSTVAGVNVATRNTGVGVLVQAAGQIRLAKLFYRVDIAPDVAMGTVSGPVRYRLVVVAGSNVPPDISAWQAPDQSSSTANQPDLATGSPLEVLFDVWLDFSAGDSGLARLAEVSFADAGPSAPGGSTMMVFLVPILDPQMPQDVVPANGTVCNAQLTVAAFGLGDGGSSLGGSSNPMQGKSLPRYDVAVNG